MHQQRTPTRATRAISSDHLALGAVVRELRARHAVSQEELGFRAGLHRNYVGAIERGEINPTYRTLMTLANGLEVRLSSVIRLCELRQARRVGTTHQPHRQPSAGGVDQPATQDS